MTARTAAAGVEFTVSGQQYSKPRPRVTNGHAYYPDHKGYERWRTDVQAALLKAAGPGMDPDDGLYSVTAYFFLAGKRRKDIDNLVGAILDALTGLVWLDDSQVVGLHVYVERDSPWAETTVHYERLAR